MPVVMVPVIIMVVMSVVVMVVRVRVGSDCCQSKTTNDGASNRSHRKAFGTLIWLNSAVEVCPVLE